MSVKWEPPAIATVRTAEAARRRHCLDGAKHSAGVARLPLGGRTSGASGSSAVWLLVVVAASDCVAHASGSRIFQRTKNQRTPPGLGEGVWGPRGPNEAEKDRLGQGASMVSLASPKKLGRDGPHEAPFCRDVAQADTSLLPQALL